jgi:2-desacetyl-2-hydroxyethyl bacteriochlorophyllide A dehydrogenase
MRALQFEKPASIRYIDVPEPPPPGPGEAVVRVHRVGVCGTDYGGYLGKMPFFSYPRIPGHELGVEVAAVGPGVENVRPGDRCSVEPYLNCRQCSACRRGHTNCCENNQTLGVHCDGGLQRLYTLPARKLHPAPSLTHEQAALVETLAIGRHAVNRSVLRAGETALVVGAGPIGLSAVEFTRLAGARTIVMDVNERRLGFVREAMRIGDTIQAKGDDSDVEALARLTDGELAHVVIDATGSNRSMSAALKFCAFAGRLVFVGITSQEVTFGHPLMHRRELTLLASRNALPGDFTAIIGAIGAGEIDTRPWITHRAPFDEAGARFAGWLSPDAGVIKAVIELE